VGNFLDRAQRALPAIRAWFRAGGVNTGGPRGETGSASGLDDQTLSLRAIRAISHGETPAGLPEVLCRAFESASLASTDDRFVGRAACLDVVQAALAQWRAGIPAMLAVTAPPGCRSHIATGQGPGVIAARRADRFCMR